MPPEHQPREAGLEVTNYDPSLKSSLGIHQRFLKECRINRLYANDRERCKGEHQCGETPIEGRSVARAAIAEGTRRNLDYGRPP